MNKFISLVLLIVFLLPLFGCPAARIAARRVHKRVENMRAQSSEEANTPVLPSNEQ